MFLWHLSFAHLPALTCALARLLTAPLTCLPSPLVFICLLSWALSTCPSLLVSLITCTRTCSLPPSPLPCPVCEWLMVPTGPPHLYMRSMSISGSSWCSFIFTVSVRIMCRLNIRSWTWGGGRAGCDVARVVGSGVKQGGAKTLVVEGGAGVPRGSPAQQRCCPAAPHPPRHR